MLYRFLKANGWESWRDLDEELPPRSWLIKEVEELPSPALWPPSPMVKSIPLKQRVFEREEWVVGPGRSEIVYVEKGVRADDASFGPDRPSLHREQELRLVLMRLVKLVGEKDYSSIFADSRHISAARMIREWGRDYGLLPSPAPRDGNSASIDDLALGEDRWKSPR